MLYYPATCNDCKRDFEEWYKLGFVGHNVGKGCDTITDEGDEGIEVEVE